MLRLCKWIANSILFLASAFAAWDTFSVWGGWLWEKKDEGAEMVATFISSHAYVSQALVAAIAFGVGFNLYGLANRWDYHRRPMTEYMDWLISHCGELVRKTTAKSETAELDRAVGLLRIRLAEFGNYFDVPAPILEQRPDLSLEVATRYFQEVCLPMREGNRKRARQAARKYGTEPVVHTK